MLKTYQATFKEDTDGVFSISLVNDPATQELFIALSSQEKIHLTTFLRVGFNLILS